MLSIMLQNPFWGMHTTIEKQGCSLARAILLLPVPTFPRRTVLLLLCETFCAYWLSTETQRASNI